MAGPNLDVGGLARDVVAAGSGKLDVTALSRDIVVARTGQLDVGSLSRSAVVARTGQLDVAAVFRTVVCDGIQPWPAPDEIVITGYAPTVSIQTAEYVVPTGHVVIGGFAPPFAGSEPWFDWQATVISQYANSPTILQVVELFNDWIAPGANLNAFYDLIWNIDTAEGYGLDVWGRIVGIGRVLTLPSSEHFFGWKESTTEVGWNQGPFYNGSSPVTENFSLSDTAYRQLILAKALANICNGSIPAINQILINLFGQYGQAYVVDNEDMSMVYKFGFTLSPVQYAIVANSGVFPKPAGVSVTIVQP